MFWSNPVDGAATPLVLINNRTGTDYYVQAPVELYVDGVRKVSDACGTIKLLAGHKTTCEGDSYVMDAGSYIQGRRRIAIAGQWETWSWGQTWKVVYGATGTRVAG